jgi:hypothetical protein
MICSSVYRDRFIRPSPSGSDSTSSRPSFREARHAACYPIVSPNSDLSGMPHHTTYIRNTMGTYICYPSR